MSIVLALGTVATIPQACSSAGSSSGGARCAEGAVALVFMSVAFVLLAAGAGIWSLVVAKVAQAGLLLLAFWIAAPIPAETRSTLAR